MTPRKASFKPNPRNKLGAIQNPIPREPKPYDQRRNRDLSKCGNESLPIGEQR